MTNSIVWMLLRLSPPQKLSTMSRSTEWFMNLLNILPGTLDMQFEHLQSAQFPLLPGTLEVAVTYVQRSAKKYVNLAKQDPRRARQSS